MDAREGRADDEARVSRRLRRLTAIDRSPKMIDAAARRNAAYVEAGIAEFLVMELENMNLDTRRFDRARALVEPWLAPSGTMLAVFDEPD
jgi:ubiquinone/menaquinone biosynthesis C-methylase UbiE